MIVSVLGNISVNKTPQQAGLKVLHWCDMLPPSKPPRTLPASAIFQQCSKKSTNDKTICSSEDAQMHPKFPSDLQDMGQH